MESMAEDEKARVEKQRTELGEEGLNEKKEVLEDASDENEV